MTCVCAMLLLSSSSSLLLLNLLVLLAKCFHHKETIFLGFFLLVFLFNRFALAARIIIVTIVFRVATPELDKWLMSGISASISVLKKHPDKGENQDAAGHHPCRHCGVKDQMSQYEVIEEIGKATCILCEVVDGSQHSECTSKGSRQYDEEFLKLEGSKGADQREDDDQDDIDSVDVDKNTNDGTEKNADEGTKEEEGNGLDEKGDNTENDATGDTNDDGSGQA